jgi:predicted small secreted protein
MTKSRSLLAVLALSAVGLASCEGREGPGAVRGFCPDFKVAAAPAGAAPADAATPVDNCVKRWAYSLAGTHEAADVVADAVVAACGTALSAWNQTGIGAEAEGEGEAISVTTGQPTNPLAEHYGFAQSHALLYVLQARAGRCPAPAVKDGVPVGA